MCEGLVRGMSKGSKRRHRDDRYCTAEQEAERWAAWIGKEPEVWVTLVLDEKGMRIEPIEEKS